MKIIKNLFLICLFLIVLLVGGLFLAVNLLDLNDYKDRIQTVASDQIGRDVNIEGDLGVSFFPWVGVTLGKISVNNSEGFSGSAFASIGGADVQVQVLPLLKGEINAKTIKLNGLQIDLQRDANGVTNWDDLVAAEDADTADNTEEPADQTSDDSPAINSLAIGGLEITDARISWKDLQGGTDALLENFTLKSGPIELTKAFDIETEFDVSSQSAGIASRVSGSGNVLLDLENQLYKVAGLKLDTNTQGEAMPGGALALTLGSDISADLANNSIDLQGFDLSTLGISLKGNMAVTNFDTEALVTANLSADSFSPAEVMEKLDIELPQTADTNVLKQASLQFEINASPKAAELQNFTMKLDDSTFTGNVQLPDLAGDLPPVRFNLELDSIDLDRYLPPTSEDTEASTETNTSASAPEASGDEPIELPIDMMRKLDIDGRFRVSHLKVANLTTNNIEVPLTASRGAIGLDGIAASLYQGSMTSNMGVNVSSETPTWRFDHVLSGVQAEPLLVDMLQDKAPITGQADFTTKITTSGNTINQMKATLNGSYSSDFTDGAVNGINLGYQLRRAAALLKGQELPAKAESVRTDFSALHLGATIVNGVVQSDDLDVRAPAMRIGGKGNVDLVKEYVDYTLQTKIVGTAEGQGGQDLSELKGLALSIPIRGSFDDLAADFAGTMLAGIKDNLSGIAKDKAKALAKAEADKIKAEAQARLDEAQAQAEARIAEERAAIEQQLQEEATKQKERINEEVDKVKDKARDKLKSLFK